MIVVRSLCEVEAIEIYLHVILIIVFMKVHAAFVMVNGDERYGFIEIRLVHIGLRIIREGWV